MYAVGWGQLLKSRWPESLHVCVKSCTQASILSVTHEAQVVLLVKEQADAITGQHQMIQRVIPSQTLMNRNEILSGTSQSQIEVLEGWLTG